MVRFHICKTGEQSASWCLPVLDALLWGVGEKRHGIYISSRELWVMQCISCISLSGLCIACWQLDVGLTLLNSFTQFHNALCSLLPVCGGVYFFCYLQLPESIWLLWFFPSNSLENPVQFIPWQMRYAVSFGLLGPIRGMGFVLESQAVESWEWLDLDMPPVGAVVSVDRKDKGRVMLRHIPSENGVDGFRQSFFIFK